MDPVSIFGIISGAASLLQAAADASKYLKGARHLGEQVNILIDNLEDFKQIKVQVGPQTQREIDAIDSAAAKCAVLLAKYAQKNQGPRLGRIFYWSKGLEEDIAEINRQLQRQKDQLVMNKLATIENIITSNPSSWQNSPGVPPSYSSPVISPFRSSTIPAYQQYSATSSSSGSMLPPPKLSRKGSLDFIPLPATIKIEDLEPIKLERVNILERDPHSRVLQYESKDRTVIVTHRIPYGTIPTTDNERKPHEVRFLAAHEIALEDSKGFRIFKTDPTYRFKLAQTCESFIEKVRERTLLAFCVPFSVTRIRNGAEELLSRVKATRIWAKEVQLVNGTTSRLITLTTLRRGEDGEGSSEQQEIGLDAYDRRAKLIEERKGVEIGRPDQTECLRVIFTTEKDAKVFHDKYEEIQTQR